MISLYATGQSIYVPGSILMFGSENCIKEKKVLYEAPERRKIIHVSYNDLER